MKSISILIAAFVAVLIGMALLGTVASTAYGITGRGIGVVDERFNVSSSYNGASGFMNQTIHRSFAHEGIQCSSGDGNLVDGSVVVTNASGTVLTSGNYTVNYENSSILFKNTTTTDPVSNSFSFFGGNISLIDYGYQGNDYICTGWQRTILNMVPGFFGLAIFAIGVGLFYKIAQEEGILGKL